ncbi:MAG: uroporphyrinogen-III synthase [Bacteroidales bacterium]
MNLLLKNKLFISTRPQGQSDELGRHFEAAGAKMVEWPLIKIQPSHLNSKEKELFNQLENIQWLIFTSPNGVVYFFKNLHTVTGSKHLPDSLQIAVIGEKTEKTLKKLGHSASFVNPGITGKDFTTAFIQKNASDKFKPNILLALGNLAGTGTNDRLSGHARCYRINVYETVAPASIDESVLQMIISNQYDMLIITSPSGIQNFLEHMNNIPREHIRIACIGESTSRAVGEAGIIPLVYAREASSKGIVDSIIRFYSKKEHD